jgi:hypothetical protein
MRGASINYRLLSFMARCPDTGVILRLPLQTLEIIIFWWDNNLTRTINFAVGFLETETNIMFATVQF